MIDPLEEEASDKPSVWLLLQNRDYLSLWIGQMISNLGSMITYIVLPLLIYDISGSLVALATVASIVVIPVIFISPIAGVVADRYDRKHIMIISNLVQMLLSLSIPLSLDILTDDQMMVMIYVIQFLASTVNRFFFPARNASIPRIVKINEINVANSFNQTAYQVIFLLGPAAGGAISQLWGYRLAFYIDSASFGISAVFIYLITRSLRPQQKMDDNGESTIDNLLVGSRTVLHTPSLLYIFVLFTFLMIPNASFNSLIVAYCKENLGMSDAQYGLSLTFFGVGGLIGGLFMSMKGEVHQELHILTMGLGAIGIVFSSIYFIVIYWQFWLLMFFLGLINIIINIPMNNKMMKDTKDNVRGQVFSAFAMVSSLSQIVGISLGVLVADMIGLRLLYTVSALLFVLIAFIGLYVIRLKNLDQQTELANSEFELYPRPSELTGND